MNGRVGGYQGRKLTDNQGNGVAKSGSRVLQFGRLGWRLEWCGENVRCSRVQRAGCVQCSDVDAE